MVVWLVGKTKIEIEIMIAMLNTINQPECHKDTIPNAVLSAEPTTTITKVSLL